MKIKKDSIWYWAFAIFLGTVVLPIAFFSILAMIIGIFLAPN